MLFMLVACLIAIQSAIPTGSLVYPGYLYSSTESLTVSDSSPSMRLTRYPVTIYSATHCGQFGELIINQCFTSPEYFDLIVVKYTLLCTETLEGENFRGFTVLLQTANVYTRLL